jgi:hypothetical protein
MTHAPSFTSQADELRELAAECLAIVRHDGALFAAGTVRPVMRDMLAEHARNIGTAIASIGDENGALRGLHTSVLLIWWSVSRGD